MKIISVVNYKGGVGKSTVVSNMAALLALRKKKVLLVDLDPQASLTFSYMRTEEWKRSFKKDKTIKAWFEENLSGRKVKDIRKYITEDLEANRLIELQEGEKIGLIPSNIDLYRTQIELARKTSGSIFTKNKNMFTTISMLYENLKELKEYDYILMDCQPSFDMITQSAIYASDYYIVPTKLDFLSTVGVQTLVEHISDLEEDIKSWGSSFKVERNLEAKLLGVLPTMVKKRKDKLESIYENYKSQLNKVGIKLFDTEIRLDNGVDNSNGVPKCLNIKNNGTQNYEKDFDDLTIEFLNKVNKE